MKVLLPPAVQKAGIKAARRFRQADGSYRVDAAVEPIEMSQKSAQKYIDKGLAEAVNEDHA